MIVTAEQSLNLRAVNPYRLTDAFNVAIERLRLRAGEEGVVIDENAIVVAVRVEGWAE